MKMSDSENNQKPADEEDAGSINFGGVKPMSMAQLLAVMTILLESGSGYGGACGACACGPCY